MLWLCPYCKRLYTCEPYGHGFTLAFYTALCTADRSTRGCACLWRHARQPGREERSEEKAPSLRAVPHWLWAHRQSGRRLPGRVQGSGLVGSRWGTAAHRRALPASLPGAYWHGLVVWQTLAGAADGQRGARRSVSTHGGASRHTSGRNHPGQWVHRAGPEHRSGTAHTSEPRSLLRGGTAARDSSHGGRAGEERVSDHLLAPRAWLPGLPAPQTSRDIRCLGVVHPHHSVHSVCGCATRSPMGGGWSASLGEEGTCHDEHGQQR